MYLRDTFKKWNIRSSIIYVNAKHFLTYCLRSTHRFACKNCDMTFYTKYSLNNHDKKKHGEFSAQPTSGTQAKPARIKKSTIIVMPGPPDRQVC